MDRGYTMRKLRKGDWILIAIFLIITQIICIWCIDVSVSAMANNGIMTNGFTIREPAVTYHLALYGLILSSFGLISITVHNTLREV